MQMQIHAEPLHFRAFRFYSHRNSSDLFLLLQLLIGATLLAQACSSSLLNMPARLPGSNGLTRNILAPARLASSSTFRPDDITIGVCANLASARRLLIIVVPSMSDR